ncbi:MAG: FAD/NAD(P)-binding protein [Myxococcota bacterium]
MSKLDWVVVGGGPHGVCTARALQATGADVRIVDPSGSLLHRWSSRAEAVAMTWMRSPVSHHLDQHPTELHHFLHGRENADVANLARPYLRPMHAAFLRQTQHLIARDRLQEAVVAGRVESLHEDGGNLVVEGPGVSLRTRRVLVATGSNQMRIPDWARRLRNEGATAGHVFEADAELSTDIVGGGISAVQRAIEVWRRTKETVRLWVRRPIQVAEFDYDQSLARARFVRRWSRQDEAQRLNFLDKHSARGSVPPGLWGRLSNAMRRGRVRLHQGALRVERPDASGRLILTGAEGSVESNGLTLATGFEPEAIGGWLRTCADRLGLAVRGGLPRLEDDMHWGRGVYVCGPLARLRLGPIAGNLVGARWAASLLPGVRMQPY